MRPSNALKKIFFVLLFIVTMPPLFLSYYYIDVRDDLHLEQEKQKLIYVSSMAEHHLKPIIVQILEENRTIRPEDVMKWHDALQPVIDKIQSRYPEYAIGISSPSFNGLIALSPNFNEDKMGKGIMPNAKVTYETGAYSFKTLNNSVNGAGDDVISVTYPVFYKGEVIANTFAYIKHKQYLASAFRELLPSFFAIVILWYGVFALGWFVYNKFREDIKALIQQVVSGKMPERDKGSFPELDIISSAVHDLRETLKYREAEYKTLLDNCPYGIARIDQKMRRVYINQAFHTLWGTSLRTVYKQGGEYGIYSEFISLPLGDELEKVFCTGEEYEYDSHYVDEQGVGRYYRNRVTPEKDEAGQVQTALVISRDVTEKIQSEERFFKAFHMNPSMVAIISLKDKTYIDVNESFSQVLGIGREEIIGRSIDEIKFLQDGEAEKIKAHLAASCRLSNYEIKYCTKYGETRIALMSADSITLGAVECYLCVMTDITAKKQLENELARFEQLNIIGEMAAGIGHEVRNPMTTVRGYLQLFKRKEAFAAYSSQIDTMIEELDRANSIITEFLSLAKNKAVKMQLDNINHVIQRLYPLLQADALRSGHCIETVMGDIPDTCFDEKEIRQLILNLVRNGLEAMNESGVVTIRTFRQEQYIVLAVEDMGTGIAKEVMDRLGAPFVTTKDNGTGLGLPVCYRIAERHGAIINVKTSPQGTTVSVLFTETME